MKTPTSTPASTEMAIDVLNRRLLAAKDIAPLLVTSDVAQHPDVAWTAYHLICECEEVLEAYWQELQAPVPVDLITQRWKQ